MELIGRAVGRKPKIVHIPSEFLLSLGEKEVEDGYIPTMLQYNAYYSVEKFLRRLPGFRWECTLDRRPEGIRDWNESQGHIPQGAAQNRGGPSDRNLGGRLRVYEIPAVNAEKDRCFAPVLLFFRIYFPA